MIAKKRRISEACEANFEATATESKEVKLKMNVGSFYFPKQNKGEDAHFICQERQAFGVADGVGGWVKKGIDPGIFARELMSKTCSALQDSGHDFDVRDVLLEAHSRTVAIGSSTACILALKGDRLYFANVGDSGFMLFRGKRLLYTSPTQQRYFNCPYSLGNWFSGKKAHPLRVFEGELGVEEGDVVVAGTDGLLDNLHGSEIEEILQETEGRRWPEDLACEIAAAARLNSTSEEYDSPFSYAAELAGIEFVGGKRDDITVVVAEIELDEFTSTTVVT